MIEFDVDVLKPVVASQVSSIVAVAVIKALALADPDVEWSVEAGFDRDGEKIRVKIMSVA